VPHPANRKGPVAFCTTGPAISRLNQAAFFTAPIAAATISSNTAGLWIASSERILRFSSIWASFRPCMNCE
jgi:hypothetical protein